MRSIGLWLEDPGSPKRHRIDRRQRVADAREAVALILADPQPAGRGAEGEPLAAGAERQRMAVDDVLGVRLRQASARTSKLRPLSRVRVTRSLPSRGMRFSSLISGTNHAVSGSRRCATDISSATRAWRIRGAAPAFRFGPWRSCW